MSSAVEDIVTRMNMLERSLHRARMAAGFSLFALTGVFLSGFVRAEQPSNEVRTRRLVVVDNNGRPRIEIGQDRSDFRSSSSAGLTLYDSTGAERGGFGTMANGHVVLGLDAPEGVGSPMRDRIGIVVEADGSSHVMLIDNETRAVAKLQSDGKGGGGVQVFQWDKADKVVRIRTSTYDGEVRDSILLNRRN